jgi:hypothetical protein
LQAFQAAKGIGRLEEVDVFLGEIQRRLDQHAQVDQFLVQFADGARELALQRTHRRTGSAGRCSIDQVGNRLGLGKVHLAVEEGTSAEFARFGQPGAEIQAAGEQQLHDHRAAVALQFEDVFAGKGMGIGKVEQQAGVDGAAVSRLEVGQCRVTGLGVCRSAQSKGQQIAARYTDDADTTTAGGRGDGGDGVCSHLRLSGRWQPCHRRRSCG